MPQVRDLDPLVLRQEPAADLADGQPVQRAHETADLAAAVGLVAARPVVPRRPGNPSLAGRGQYAPPPLPQLHEPLTLGRLRAPPRPLLHTTRRRQHNPQGSRKLLRPSLETALPTRGQTSLAVDTAEPVTDWT